MTKTASSILSFALLCLVLSGCSDKIKANGKVRFPDGSPLTVGTVFLSDGTNMFRGDIRSDGSFSLGEQRDGDGIPPGTYGAWITNANTEEHEVDPVTGAMTDRIRKTVVIDPKFTARETSGLTFEVTAGNRKPLEITVEKP